MVRLLALVRTPGVTLAELESHICEDPRLSKMMLRLVNSVFYGIGRNVSSIREAIVILGLDRLQGLALLSSVGGVLRKEMGVLGFTRTGLLEHSIAVAIGARSIATRLWEESSVRERLFIAGLLHDLPLVFRVYPSSLALSARDLPSQTAGSGGDPWADAVAALASWGVDPGVIEIVREQHMCPASPDLCRAVAMLRIADAVASSLAIGYRVGCEPFATILEVDLETLFLQREGIWPQLLDGVVGDISASVSGLGGLLTSTA